MMQVRSRQAWRRVVCAAVSLWVTAGCAHAPARPPLPDDAPPWVRDCRRHPSTAGMVFWCAVGDSGFSDPLSRRADAEASARARLNRRFRLSLARFEKRFGEFAVEQGVKLDPALHGAVHAIVADMRLDNPAITARWVDPGSQYEYALAVGRAQDLLAAIGTVLDADPAAREALLGFVRTVFEEARADTAAGGEAAAADAEER